MLTEQESCETHNGAATGPILFLCDHAANAIPAELGTLGLSFADLTSHIAYDIGAAQLARGLADDFASVAILGRWSRLVADLNRGSDDPTVVPKLSDRRVVPGNAGLYGDMLKDRIARYHAPYHGRIAREIDFSLGRHVVPVLVSIHSFTPVWRGAMRPWHVGVLWDRDFRLARPLLAAFHKISDIVAGDNEPYTGALENDCLYRHATMRGLPHVLIEVRQDLIVDQGGIGLWRERIAGALRNALHAMGAPSILLTRPLHPPGVWKMDERTRTELEAAVFRRLVAHLRNRTDVQNIDLMNLASFCRNCLGDWYREAAAEKGIALEKDEAREVVYGMPPAEWKRRYQKEATAEQQAEFAKSQVKTHS